MKRFLQYRYGSTTLLFSKNYRVQVIAVKGSKKCKKIPKLV